MYMSACVYVFGYVCVPVFPRVCVCPDRWLGSCFCLHSERRRRLPRRTLQPGYPLTHWVATSLSSIILIFLSPSLLYSVISILFVLCLSLLLKRSLYLSLNLPPTLLSLFYHLFHFLFFYFPLAFFVFRLL